MAKQIEIDVIVNGKMQKATVSAKKLKGALDGVDKSQEKTSKSNGTMRRNMQGAAAATSNSTKEFAKMSQGMGGLVAVYAQIAAATFALSAAFQFMKDSMEIRNLMEGQKAFGAVTGVAYQSLTANIRQATNGMLSFRDAAQAAAIGTAAGLSRGQLEQLGAAAKNVSFALGRDLTDSFNRLVRGVTKAEPELLDELGIVLRLEPALKAYATAIGKNVKDLNQFEKSQAIANDVLTQAETKFAAIQQTMDPSAAALAQFQQSFNDLGDTIKSALADTLIPVFNFLKENTMSLVGALSLVALPIIKQILPNFEAMGVAAQEAYTKATQAANIAASDASQFATASRLASGSPEARAQVIQTSAARGNALGIEMKGKGAQEGMLSKRQMAVYRKHLQDKEFLRKKFNKKERAEFRRFMAEQEALLAQSQAKRVRIVKRGQMQIDAVYAKTVALYRAGQAEMVKVTGFAAKAMNGLMKLAGFVGLALLVFDIGKMLYDWLFPMSEAEKEAKKLKEQLQGATDSQKTLNEELGRMIDVRGMGDFALNAAERVTQTQQALQSTDLNKVIKDYMLLADRAGESTKDLREEYAKSAEKIAVLTGNKGFNALAKTFRAGTEVTQEQSEELLNYSNTVVQAGVALTKLIEIQKSTNAAFAAAAPSGLAFSGLATAVNAEIKSLQTALPTLRDEASRIEQEGPAAVEVTRDDGAKMALQNYKDSRAEYIKDVEAWAERNKIPTVFDEEIGRFTTPTSGRAKSEVATVNRELEGFASKIDPAVKKAEKFQKTFEDAVEASAEDISKKDARLSRLVEIYKDIDIIQTKASETEKKKQGLEQDTINLALTSGRSLIEIEKEKVSIANEKLSLAAEDAQRQVEVAELGFKNIGAEKEKLLIRKQNKEELSEEEKAAVAAYEAAVAALNTANLRVDVSERLVNLQNAMTDAKERERLLEIELLARQRARQLDKIRNDRAALTATTSQGVRQTKVDNIALDKKKLEDLQSRIDSKMDEYAGIFNAEQINQTVKGQERLRDLEAEGLKLMHEHSVLAEQIATAEAKISYEVLRALRARELSNKQLQLQQRGLSGGDSGFGADLSAGVFGASGAGQQYNEMIAQEVAAGRGDQLTDERRKEMLNQAADIANVNAELKKTEAISGAISSAFDGLFDALLDGTTSFGDAMKGIMHQLLKDMAKAYLQAAAMKALNMATMAMGIPGLPAARGGVFGASGGMMPGYAVGGIASGPKSGYPVTLHGTEAVVPLPDGRSIPVAMEGGGQNNNVSVTVNMSGAGQSQQSANGGGAGGVDGQELGRSIAGLVQQHLQDQMRPGGLLNRQGQTGRI